jgi:hypothetical protein
MNAEGRASLHQVILESVSVGIVEDRVASLGASLEEGYDVLDVARLLAPLGGSAHRASQGGGLAEVHAGLADLELEGSTSHGLGLTVSHMM